MQNSLRLAFFLIFSVCLINSVAVGQEIQATADNGFPKKFPINFVGDNPISIYQVLEKYQKSFRKSQFETTEEFGGRIRNLTSNLSLTKTKKGTDRLILVSTVFNESYDADLKTYTLSLDLESNFSPDYDVGRLGKIVHGDIPLIEEKEFVSRRAPKWEINILNRLDGAQRTGRTWQTLELGSVSRNFGIALGQNAFGVKRRYRIKTYTSLHLAMFNKNSGFDSKLSFSATPQEARSISGHLAVAIVGTLRYPFISKDKSSDKATLTEPEESHYFNYFLLFESSAIALYDVRTGKIYKQFAVLGKTQDEVAGEEDSGIISTGGKLTRPFPPEGVYRNQSSRQTDSGHVGKNEEISKTISGSGLNGKVISMPKAPYPTAARAVRASGAVSVQVLIDENGAVVSATAVSGHPLLRAAAVEAAREARFSPTLSEGIPIKVSGVLTYNFIP